MDYNRGRSEIQPDGSDTRHKENPGMSTCPPGIEYCITFRRRCCPGQSHIFDIVHFKSLVVVSKTPVDL